MSTILEIEKKIIETISGPGTFKVVESVVSDELPPTLNYPAAFMYFESEDIADDQVRPVYKITYGVIVVNKNLRSEQDAAQDTYGLLDTCRDALQGKTLGFTDITPFVCTSRELLAYNDGIISYLLKFTTKNYLPAPPGWRR